MARFERIYHFFSKFKLFIGTYTFQWTFDEVKEGDWEGRRGETCLISLASCQNSWDPYITGLRAVPSFPLLQSYGFQMFTLSGSPWAVLLAPWWESTNSEDPGLKVRVWTPVLNFIWHFLNETFLITLNILCQGICFQNEYILFKIVFIFFCLYFL